MPKIKDAAQITGIIFVGSNDKVSFNANVGLVIPEVKQALSRYSNSRYLTEFSLIQLSISQISKIHVIQIGKRIESNYSLDKLQTQFALNGFFLKTEEQPNKIYHYFWERVK